jgi:transcriptional regulator with XRE-family HTH domain
MDRSYLAEIESGVANPSVDILERIAKALAVPIRDLFS